MPQTKAEYEDYLKFIDQALEVARKLPRYFSKFSNHRYCNHQKLVIVVLMQKLKLTTRGIVSFLRNNPLLALHIGLTRIPVHTTIVRFFVKVKQLLGCVLDIRYADTVAVDATGFELEAKSYYYRNVWNSNQKRKTKQYLKLSIAIDTEKQLILAYRMRRKFRHDTKDFKHVLHDLHCATVVADKGYDDHKLRRYVINHLHATPVIPVRNHTNFYGYLQQGRKINGMRYHQRSKVETVFSVLKRKYGSILRCKSFATQKVELLSKLITYNVDRTVNYLLLIIEGCTRAESLL